MTLPLIVLAVFAVAAGWVGIPQDFPLHRWLAAELVRTSSSAGRCSSTRRRSPSASSPLLTSLGRLAAAGCSAAGWSTAACRPARPIRWCARSGPVHTLLESKYYFDELYDVALRAPRPTGWRRRSPTSSWIDRKVIDGVLHGVARLALQRGRLPAPLHRPAGRQRCSATWWARASSAPAAACRVVQTGRVQGYLVVGRGSSSALLLSLLSCWCGPRAGRRSDRWTSSTVTC